MSKEDKHFPFLDKETDILGLEIFDLGAIAVVSITAAILTFFLIPFKLFSIFVASVILIVGYILVKKKKTGKERGWLYRQYLKKSRKFNKIF